MSYQRSMIRHFGNVLICFCLVNMAQMELHAIDLDAGTPLESKQAARKVIEAKVKKGEPLPKLFKGADLEKSCKVVRLDAFAGKLSFDPGINSVLFGISVLPGTEGPNCVLIVEIPDLISVEEFKRFISTDVKDGSTSVILNFDIIP